MNATVPFNKPFIIGRELYYVSQCILHGQSAGDGPYTKRCQASIGQMLCARHVLLTTSCASALHMAALLCRLEPGDEVILPSYCGAAAASAFHAVGARLVFVEVDADSLNLSLDHLEDRLSDRTRVVLPYHYNGACCDMNRLRQIVDGREVRIIENAADAFGARYRDQALGTLGAFGTFSFHESKSLTCGEGGALVIGDDHDFERAEVLREKGTNRSQFFRGQVDKYTWVDVGSSYVPSDLLAAYLAAQLERSQEIFEQKRRIHDFYGDAFAPLVETGQVQRQHVLPDCQTNHHGFLLLVESEPVRAALIEHLATRGITAVFHYTPLHESSMGRRLGYRPGELPVTETVSRRVVRLPSFHDLTRPDAERVVRSVYEFYAVDPPV